MGNPAITTIPPHSQSPDQDKTGFSGVPLISLGSRPMREITLDRVSPSLPQLAVLVVL